MYRQSGNLSTVQRLRLQVHDVFDVNVDDDADNDYEDVVMLMILIMMMFMM